MIRYATVLSLVLAMLLVTGCSKDEKETTEKQAEKTGEAGVKQAEEVGEDASVLLEKVQQCIKDGDLDQAEAELKKLGGMKDLPSDLQEKIKAARMSLTAARSAKKLDVPKLP